MTVAAPTSDLSAPHAGGAAVPGAAPDGSAVIRGSTQLYPVLGSPIAQVKAPMLYNALFASTGFDAVCVPIEIAPDDYPTVFTALFRARNIRGAFVTIPHKAATVALLDACSDAVRIAGACNAVVRRADGSLYGDLFDGVGFVRAAERSGFTVAASRCLVVGAGGAGAAIAAALATAGAATVRLFDTRSAHASELASRLQTHFANCRVEAGPAQIAAFDLVVNATPLGMEPDDALPVDVEQITPATTIVEIVMKREITPLIAAARAKGCRTVLGKEMLREQMPLYLEFLGLPPMPSDAERPAAIEA
jgi:shikimate dehydrogenase